MVLLTLQSSALTGVTQIPATPITGFVSGLDFLITQAVGPNALTWANVNTSLTLAMEISFDGAQTWVGGGSTSHTGMPGSKLASATQMGLANVGWFDANNAPIVPTHFRGTITVTNGPLSVGFTAVAH
jgi:hypothetical protein